MSDISALAEKLTALATKDDIGDAGGRLISKGGVPDPLTAILKEIDETVLERDLEFIAGDKRFNLIVAGRRLRGIQAIAGASEDETAALGQTLSREEPDFVAQVHQIIAGQIAGAPSLTVRSNAPGPFGKGGERGISAQGLAALWNVAADATPAPPMERFLATNAATITAMMHVKDGEVAATTGDFETLKTIWETQLAAFQEAHQKQSGRSDDPQLICLEGVLEDGSDAAMAFAGSEVALVVYQPDQLGALHASWQAIFG